MTRPKKPPKLTKRANGDGTVYQDGDRWVAAITLPGGVRRKRIRATKQAAEAALAELIHQRDAGLAPHTADQTLGTYLGTWLTTIKRHEVRHHTYENYTSIVRHLNSELGGVRLIDLKPSHITVLRSGMIDAGYAPQTINLRLSILRQVLHRAVEVDELIPRNPARKIGQVPNNRPERATLSPEHVKALLTHAAGTEWYALWLVLLGTGVRPGEALALRWDDIEGTVLHIRGTVTRAAGVMAGVIGPPKTRTSRRDLALPRTVAAAFKSHRPMILRRQAAATQWADMSLVFPGRFGGVLRTQTISDALARALIAIDAPHLTPHALRHTFATQHLELGTRLEVVQRQLGHASSTMTSDLYTHVRGQLHEEAAERIDTLLRTS